MRTVPCIAGCDGPMLRRIGSRRELELAFVELVIDRLHVSLDVVSRSSVVARQRLRLAAEASSPRRAPNGGELARA